MIKSILSIFLLLSLLGIASSDIFNPVSSNNGFATSTDLRGIYEQRDNINSQSTGGYHKANVYFQTKVPSINLDQSGVSNIECNDGKISFTANDKDAIGQVNNWPDKVMLLISHRWKCNGKSTTQFYMVSNKVVDVPNKKATFTAEVCKVEEWSERYVIDMSWVENGGSKKRGARRGRGYRRNKRADPIDISNKLSLNVLFDEKTGKTSKPNFSLLNAAQNNTGESLSCANCFMSGEATIALKVAGNFIPPKLTEASISLNGNIKMNLDLAVDGKVVAAISPPNVQILNLPLSPLGVPNVFNLGPSIDLSAAVKISADVAGTVRTGCDISLPNFVVTADFVDKPKFVQTGFKPETTSHDPTVGAAISADITGSLKPQLAFGLDVLNGAFTVKTGFQMVASLGSSISVSSDGECKDKPRVKTTLNGNFGFFLRGDDFSIVDFPPVTLLNKCVE